MPGLCPLESNQAGLLPSSSLRKSCWAESAWCPSLPRTHFSLLLCQNGPSWFSGCRERPHRETVPSATTSDISLHAPVHTPITYILFSIHMHFEHELYYTTAAVRTSGGFPSSQAEVQFSLIAETCLRNHPSPCSHVTLATLVHLEFSHTWRLGDIVLAIPVL